MPTTRPRTAAAAVAEAAAPWERDAFYTPARPRRGCFSVFAWCKEETVLGGLRVVYVNSHTYTDHLLLSLAATPGSYCVMVIIMPQVQLQQL